MPPKVWVPTEVLEAVDLNVVSGQADNALKPDGNLSGLANTATALVNLGLGSGGPNIATLASNLGVETGGLVIADLAAQLAQIYIGTITLTQPTLNKNHQRITTTGGAFSKGEGPVPLVISCTEPPSRLDFRVRNAASPASVLQDWTTLDFQRITGTQTVSPMIPAGFYSYLIDIRPNQDAAKIVSTTNAVTVGHIVAIAGQSLALDLFSPVASGDTTTIATLGLTISTWGRVYASYGVNSGAFPAIPDSLLVNSPPASWELPNDAGNFDSTGVVVIISRLEGVLGVPVSPVGFAVGGTGIDTWLPDYAGTGTDHHVRLLSILDAAGFNGFSSMVWFQGHYESRNGNTAPLYLAQLQEFFTVLRARYGQFQAAMCSIGAIGSYVGSVANINMVRATMLAYVASDPLSAYFDALDPNPDPDLVHASQAGNVRIAIHIYRAICKQLGIRSAGARGPVLNGTATRPYNSATITLPVTQTAGGTAWVETGDCIDQFVVYNDAAPTTPVTISDINVSNPAQLGIVLASAPTEPASLKVWYRPSPDTSGIIANSLRDNITDGDGITIGRQLGIYGQAIVCAVPVVVLTIASIADGNAGASLSLSGTYSNGLPASLEYSVDLGATWTTATTPTIGSGSWSFTIAGGLPVGVYKMRVRDPLSLGSIDSNVFNRAQVSPPAITTITSPIFGLNAAAPNGHFFTDTGRTVQAFVGSNVRGISDLTGSGNHFSQPTSALAPVFEHNIKNGLPGLRFNGTTGQLLDLVVGGTLGSTLKSSTGYTMLLIYTPAGLPAVAFTIFCACEIVKVGGLNLIRGAQGLAAGTVRASRNSDALAYQPTVSGAITANLLNKQVVRYDDAADTLKVKINALTEAGVTTATLGTNAFDGITIGAERTNSNATPFYFDGHLHQFYIWNSAASDVNRDALITYATTQWGS
jgi:hypothetical protein